MIISSLRKGDSGLVNRVATSQQRRQFESSMCVYVGGFLGALMSLSTIQNMHVIVTT